MSRRKLYNIILADPPWQYRDSCSGERGAVYKYNILKQDDLLAMPVERIAADNCVLFLWATWPKLYDAFEVIEAWGFSYKTLGFLWVKTTKNGKMHWGMGNWSRANTEPCLLAIRGNPKRVDMGVHSVVIEPVTEHSRKPLEVHKRIVRLMGHLPRVELFAQVKQPKWDAWGDMIRCSNLFPGWHPQKILKRQG